MARPMTPELSPTARVVQLVERANKRTSMLDLRDALTTAQGERETIARQLFLAARQGATIDGALLTKLSDEARDIERAVQGLGIDAYGEWVRR